MYTYRGNARWGVTNKQPGGILQSSRWLNSCKLQNYVPQLTVLTEYFDGVDNFYWLQNCNLTGVVASVLCLHVADLQVVSVHQANSVVWRHLGGASSQHCNALLPHQHVMPCNGEKQLALLLCTMQFLDNGPTCNTTALDIVKQSTLSTLSPIQISNVEISWGNCHFLYRWKPVLSLRRAAPSSIDNFFDRTLLYEVLRSNLWHYIVSLFLLKNGVAS